MFYRIYKEIFKVENHIEIIYKNNKYSLNKFSKNRIICSIIKPSFLYNFCILFLFKNFIFNLLFNEFDEM